MLLCTVFADNDSLLDKYTDIHDDFYSAFGPIRQPFGTIHSKTDDLWLRLLLPAHLLDLIDFFSVDWGGNNEKICEKLQKN